MKVYVHLNNVVTRLYDHIIDHMTHDSEHSCTMDDIIFMFHPKPTTSVPQKQQKALISRVKQIIQQDSFYSSLHTYDNSLNTLKDMLEEGIDVRLILPLTCELFLVKPVSMTEYTTVSTPVILPTDVRMQWIKKVIGKAWLERIVFCNKEFYSHLQCDLFILDAHSIYTLKCEKLIFGQETFSNWKDWRKFVGGQSNDIKFTPDVPFFRHGSPNSVDIDLIYVFPSKPDFKFAKDFLKEGEKIGEDRNIVTIKDGVISYCYIGIIDSVNNALLTTYSMHDQQFPLPIQRRIKRVVPMKVNETILHVLVKLRKIPSIREGIVSAIKSFDFETRKNMVQKIDFTKHELDVDTIKTLAFRFSQTLALIHGHECFTKDVTIEQYPLIKPLLYRETPQDPITHLKLLNEFRDMFLDCIRGVSIEIAGDLHMYRVTEQVPVNWFNVHCNGLVIDYRYELLRFYPLDNAKEGLSAPEWPEDELGNIDTSNIVSVFAYTPSNRSGLSKYTIKLGNECFVLTQLHTFESALLEQVFNYLGDNGKSRMRALQKALAFDQYYYVFRFNNEKLSIVAMRNSLTNLLEPAEIVKQVNDKLDF
jgi:hypothetical protein